LLPDHLAGPPAEVSHRDLPASHEADGRRGAPSNAAEIRIILGGDSVIVGVSGQELIQEASPVSGGNGKDSETQIKDLNTAALL